MRKQRFKQQSLFTAFIIAFVFIVNDLLGEARNLVSHNNSNTYTESNFIPDSTFEDTSNLNFGDTVEAYVDGADSVYVLSVGSDSTNRLVTAEDIFIRLTSIQKNVEDGNYGVCISDFFKPRHASETDNFRYDPEPDPWELISEMAPTVLRYPGGSSSKFRHAFGSMNTADWNPRQDFKNGGYGISLEEILAFYDATDDGEIEMNPTLAAAIIDDMNQTAPFEPLTLSEELDWLSDREVSNFEDFYREWHEQPYYLPGTYAYTYLEPLYLNQLIRLVQKIETENEGLDVKVILVVNIMSEPAAAVRDMITYLQDATLNNTYSVNVYGIELGNECFFKVFEDLIGFADVSGTITIDGITEPSTKSSFDHYWAFINGAEDYTTYFGWDTPVEEFDLSQVLPTSMYGIVEGFQAHDYIGLLRSDPDMDNVKIGIPAAPPIDPEGPFIVAEEDMGDGLIGIPTSSPWNEDLYGHYADIESGKPAFDAVIAHLYFIAETVDDPILNKNWGEIPLGIDTDEAIDGEFRLDNDDDDEFHDNFNTPFSHYTHDVLDLRLDDSFKAVVGIGNETGNFKEFLKSRHRISMQILAAELHFDPSELNPKECWLTEWNIKNDSKYPAADLDGPAKELRRDVYNNSFVHAYLIQEQYLNTLRFNSNNNPTEFGMRNDFNTIGTIQNFLGGSSIQLVTQAGKQDKIALGLESDCSPSFDYYVPRTLYHSYNLLGSIHQEDLEYVSTIKNMFESNINLAPTIFISYSPTSAARDVYGYFTNVKSGPQTYIVRPGTLTPITFAGINAEINCIDVKQLYSGSGKSALYDINDSYADCALPTPSNYFEIRGQEPAYIDTELCPTDVAADAMCVTVPAYSLGYFVFSFDPSLRVGEIVNKFQLFPNPSSTYFTITQTDTRQDEFSNLTVRIYSMYGELVYQSLVDENESIAIENLPVGCYQVHISDNYYIEAEMFIKMK